ncbi:MAG TPA: hypothetical protein VLU73_08205 [Methylococcaceae bacterium]|nr:hypothetical protein [Methylococcaceae bacterium]
MIWKVPCDGGKAIQVTRDQGMDACESADGYVYYHGYNDLQKKGIWRVPASGGTGTLVLDKEIDSLVWDLSDRGIYFIDRAAKPVATICFYDFATRSVSTLAPVHGDPEFQTVNSHLLSPT